MSRFLVPTVPVGIHTQLHTATVCIPTQERGNEV